VVSRILPGPEGRARGAGPRAGLSATGLLLDYAFTSLDLFRVELEVYEFNPRARRVYERAGFVLEGRRRGPALLTSSVQCHMVAA